MKQKILSAYTGESLLINPGEIHSACSADKKTCIIQAFVFRLNDIQDSFENYNIDKDICTKILSIDPNNKDDLYLFKSFIYALLYSMKINGQIKTCTPDSLNANIIKKVLTFINEHYFEEITIDELAAVSGFSKSHFIREFKKQTGITPMIYLNPVRIEKSKALLTSGNSILDTAFKVRFNNSSYFIKVFKSLYGLTPKQYMNTEKDR